MVRSASVESFSKFARVASELSFASSHSPGNSPRSLAPEPATWDVSGSESEGEELEAVVPPTSLHVTAHRL
eukprot:849005-Pyramimonas_sp.AAC.1